MAEVKIMLADDQEKELKAYLYTVAMEAITSARKDSGLDKDLMNKKECCKFLDVSNITLDEYIKLGLPYSVLGPRSFYFSKARVREWVLNFNKN